MRLIYALVVYSQRGWAMDKLYDKHRAKLYNITNTRTIPHSAGQSQCTVVSRIWYVNGVKLTTSRQTQIEGIKQEARLRRHGCGRIKVEMRLFWSWPWNASLPAIDWNVMKPKLIQLRFIEEKK